MRKITFVLVALMLLSGFAFASGSTEEAAPADPNTVKVGLLCIGDENDQGYTYNFIRGRDEATEMLKADGINVEWVTKFNIGEDATCTDANIEAAEEGYSRFAPVLEEMKVLEERTGMGGSDAMAAAEKLSECHEILTSSGYYSRRPRIETILFGLGFTKADLQRPAREFSGGYQMRIALARILLESPDFLFLDEPTNYLDIEALVWLEEYLKAFDGGLMVVSHDQDFLDDIAHMKSYVSKQ